MGMEDRTGPKPAAPPASAAAPLAVLLVDDDDGVAHLVCDGLNPALFSVQRVATSTAALAALGSRRFDVLLLDLILPDGSGLKMAERLRRAGSALPIIMLTSRDRVEQRVEGLSRGADDYLCKPFAVEELAARILAVCRRLAGAATHTLRFSDVQLDLIKRVASRRDITVELSSREAELLAFFMTHPEEVLSRERILEQVWGAEADDGSNVLNVYVNYLRNKLERGLFPRLIYTVRGVGYLLSTTDPEDRPPA